MSGTYWLTILPAADKLEQGIKDAVAKAGKDTKVQVDADTSKVEKNTKAAIEKVSKSPDAKVKVDVDADTRKAESKVGELGRKMGKSLDDATAGMGSKFDGVADQWGRSIGGKLGDAIRGGLKDIGIDTGPLTTEINHVGDKVKEAEGWVKDIGGLFDAMPGKVGAVATGLAEWGGPIALAVAGLKEAEPIITRIDDAIRNSSRLGADLEKFDPSGWGDWLGEHLGAKQSRKFFGNMFGYDPGDHDDAAAPSGKDSDYNGLLLGHGGGGDQASSNFKPGGDPKRWGDTLNSGGDAYDFFSSGAPLPAAPSAQTSNLGAAPADVPYPMPIKPRNVGSDKGLTSGSKNVKQVVSTLFPQISDIGGWRPPDGYNEHSSGQALDVMIPNWSSPEGKALGDQISQYVLEHSKELGVDYTIWQHGQHNPDGSFQMYEDRGGATQNHMDHVHIHTAGGGSAPPDAVIARDAGSTSSRPGSAVSSAGPSGPSFMSGGSGPAGTAADPIFVIPAGGGGAGPGGGGGASSVGAALSGGGSGGFSAQFGDILKGGVSESFLPQGFSNPMGWPNVKSLMAGANFLGGLMPGQAGGGQKGDGTASALGNALKPGLPTPAQGPGLGDVPLSPVPRDTTSEMLNQKSLGQSMAWDNRMQAQARGQIDTHPEAPMPDLLSSVVGIGLGLAGSALGKPGLAPGLFNGGTGAMGGGVFNPLKPGSSASTSTDFAPATAAGKASTTIDNSMTVQLNPDQKLTQPQLNQITAMQGHRYRSTTGPTLV